MKFLSLYPQLDFSLNLPDPNWAIKLLRGKGLTHLTASLLPTQSWCSRDVIHLKQSGPQVLPLGVFIIPSETPDINTRVITGNNHVENKETK